MKKLLLLLTAFALVAGLSQCKKPNMPVLNIGETQHVVLNASWDNGGAKLGPDGTLFKWTIGDKLYVDEVDGTPIGTLICKDPDNGTFEGYIMKTTEKIKFTFKGAKYKEGFMEQTGALDDAVLLRSPELTYSAVGNYGKVSMTMPHAVLKLNLSAFGTPEGITVTIKEVGGGTVASVSKVKNTSTEVYVAVLAPNAFGTSGELVSKQYEFESSVGSASCNGWKLVNNTFYTLENENGAAIVVTPQAPAAKFTVGKDGSDNPITVEFAPGNLYWDGTESKFKFEANQWSTTPASSGTWNASHVSHFFWSNTTDWQTSDKEPYAASYSFSKRTENDNFFTNATETTANHDFHVNGETGTNQWRTLSKGEWEYLIGKSSSGRDASLREWSAVTFGDSGPTVSGLIIMPDGYDFTTTPLTDGVGTDGVGTTSYVRWQALESSGAVFLPAAGKRDGTAVSYVGSSGLYWTSTPHEDEKDFAYNMDFGSGGLFTNGNFRNSGRSVRLVR